MKPERHPHIRRGITGRAPTRVLAVMIALAICSPVALARPPSAGAARAPIVGGAPMLPTRNIMQNAVASRDHTTLVKAIKVGGLVDTLSGPGPFTVFAPTDLAFKKLPPGAVDNLLRPENKAQLQTVLTYHVVQGAITTKDLAAKIKDGGGKAQLKTVQGEPLTVEQKGRLFEVVDAKGNTAQITVPNVTQSNGVIYVVNTVLLP